MTHPTLSVPSSLCPFVPLYDRSITVAVLIPSSLRRFVAFLTAS
jgi:hypothetical protein